MGKQECSAPAQEGQLAIPETIAEEPFEEGGGSSASFF